MEGPSRRACEACRSLKVRCLPDENGSTTCLKCARLGRPCSYPAVQKRKPRKKTDTRIAELEQEMRKMRALLRSRRGVEQQYSQLRRAGIEGESVWQDETTTGNASAPRTSQRLPTRQPAQLVPGVRKVHDVIDRGILDLATARELLNKYRDLLTKQHPAATVDASYTVEQIRYEKPTLFLAIMAAAATIDRPDLSVTLDAELLRTYAERVLINSEKSLELVQALLISAAWYAPPDRFHQLKYYKYIHMAAVMSMELGIATRPPTARRHVHVEENVHPAEDTKNPDLSMAPRNIRVEADLETTEARRTFLNVFCLTTSSAFSLRRPSLLKVTPYFMESLDLFERATDTVPLDQTLIAWVKLSIITADFSEAFHFDDPAKYADIGERSIQSMLKEYERQLSQWRLSVSEEFFQPGLRISYYFCRMALHEVALYIDHSPEDFRAPYNMGGLRPHPDCSLPVQMAMDCINECVSSAHNIIEAYSELPVEAARALPVLLVVRIAFAAFIIAKLCLSSTSKDSRIAGLIDRPSLKAEEYIDKMILHARNVIGAEGRRVPAILMALLFKVRAWCADPELVRQSKVGMADEDRQQELEPPQHAAQGTQDKSQVTEQVTAAAYTAASLEHLDLDPDFYSFLDHVNIYHEGFGWTTSPNAI